MSGQNRQLRELGSSSEGWALRAGRLLNAGGGAGADHHSGFSTGLPACPHPANLLKGPMLGCYAGVREPLQLSRPRHHPEHLGQSPRGDQTYMSWASPLTSLPFVLARLGGGVLTPGLRRRPTPHILLLGLFASEVSSGFHLGRESQPEILQQFCAHWRCNLDLCRSGPQFLCL